MATIEISENNTPEVFKALQQCMDDIGEKWCRAAERYAKALTPVVTGRLINSITAESDVMFGAVVMNLGTSVEYAPVVELGGRGREGKHMLTKAIEDHLDTYSRIASNECQRNL